ncbi:carboxypeptidase-like regulatory domain-containing protein [Chitinivibrio alkaliphilus]|uniref:Uncharacterized protein n=1 Tax=Chitinivibrio alkaliphilus ACht1 TaxID=1313304 RepID=U7D711_9BACT|nr:carboxypeptidase-like regulatory domain-containing protein [Chitinivibrio alkaliphilus]ERP38760.1 hypothetical protein CALK_0779 [Chitinivibrio alkaliphilus ACht1]
MIQLILMFLFVVFSHSLWAGDDVPPRESTEYVLTEFPLAILPQDTAVWIKWAGIARPGEEEIHADGRVYPDSGYIYLSRDPGGRDLENYEIRLDPEEFEYSPHGELRNNVLIDDKSVLERGIQFVPSKQSDLEAGIYYLVVGFPTTVKTPFGQRDTTFVSNEIQFIVRHRYPPEAIAPIGDTLSDVTPRFRWHERTDVPYYHVIVLEGELDLGDTLDFDDLQLDDLNIMWQAVTEETEITYGAPDPSGIITASPKPLSAGETYTWLVLNNYGNNPVMTAAALVLPSEFFIDGESLAVPINISPMEDEHGRPDTLSEQTISFSWTNLDPLANTYQLYIYKQMDEGDLSGKTPVWDQEYSASRFSDDTATVEMSAINNLSKDDYAWSVVAKDDQGRGTSGPYSDFYYDVPAGSLVVLTREVIEVAQGNFDTATIAMAEIETEILSGSMETMIFYTNEDGWLGRSRPVGSMRMRAHKDGYDPSPFRTVDIVEDSTSHVTLYLTRPNATLYGKVEDADGSYLSGVTVQAISDRGDTVTTESDSRGNYSLSCYEDSWNISARRTGYSFSGERRVSLSGGESKRLEDHLRMHPNEYTIRGTVVNSRGTPVISTEVDLLDQEGTRIEREPATPSSGEFSFTVNSGTYIVRARKSGFVTARDTFSQVTGLRETTLTLKPGAEIVEGRIFGQSYNSRGETVFAPIRNMDVHILQDDDTIDIVQTDNVFGRFSASLPALQGDDTYELFYERTGYPSGEGILTAGESEYRDTLITYATLPVEVVSVDGLSREDVLVRLARGSQTLSADQADPEGMVLLMAIPDTDSSDTVALRASGGGFILDSLKVFGFDETILSSDSLSVSEGRLLAATTPVAHAKVFMKEGELDLHLRAEIYDTENTPLDVGETGRFRFHSPFSKTRRSGDTLTQIGPDSYSYSLTTTIDTIIDCTHGEFTITPEDALTEDTIRLTQALPFTHTSQDTMEVDSEGAISLSLNNRGYEHHTVDSVYLWYRAEGRSSFSQKQQIPEENARTTFRLTPPQSGVALEYYFQVFTSEGTIFGHPQQYYTSFIEANPSVVSRFETRPSLDDHRIPQGYEVRFDVVGFYGDNFTRLSLNDFSTENVSISSRNDRFRIRRGRDAYGNRIITMSPRSAGADTLEIAFREGMGLTLGPDVADTMTIPLEVLDVAVDSLDVRPASRIRNNRIENSGQTQFICHAYTPEGESVRITPNWEVSPDSAGTIDVSGIFTPARNFSGPVHISAALTGDKVATYTHDDQPLLVRHSVRPQKQTITDFRNVFVDIPAQSLRSGDNSRLTISHFTSGNKIKTDIPERGVSRASGVYTLRRSGDRFNRDSVETDDGTYIPEEEVYLRVRVPEKYRSKIDEDGENISLAVWDEDSLGWAHPWRDNADGNDNISYHFVSEGIEYSPHTQELTVPVGKILNRVDTLRFAVAYENQESISASVDVLPNPFSPFVPNGNRDLMGAHRQIEGTSITVHPMNSSTRSSITVTMEIFSVLGDKVWEAEYHGVSPGDPLRVIWDGRTRINKRESLNPQNEEQTLYLRGDSLCRNGRYFLVVTMDDGSEIKRYRQEIILFK